MESVRNHLQNTKAPGLSINTLAKKTNLSRKVVAAICNKNFTKVDPIKFGSQKHIGTSSCFSI